MVSSSQRVLEIVSRASGKAVHTLNLDDRLFHDLHLDGDDAEELMLKFCEAFELPTSDFPFNQYFGAEFGAGYRHFLAQRIGLAKKILKPLTISDLVQCAQDRSFSVLGQSQ